MDLVETALAVKQQGNLPSTGGSMSGDEPDASGMSRRPQRFIVRASSIAAESISYRPRSVFAAFLVVHAVVWTALPVWLFPNLPLDIIEGLTYGREWQLGSDKLPPLPWWIIEILYRAFGSDAAYYAFAQVSVLAAFVAVWLTARPIVGSVGALLAVLILDGLHFFNFTAVKFNHDVIQLPIWAVAGLALFAGLRTGALRFWLLLGAALGLALWAKYFVVVIAIPIVLFMLLDRDARKAWQRPGPWVAIVVALIVAAPHVWWLVEHDFAPLHYVDARARPARTVLDYLLNLILYPAGQLFFLLPSLLIACPLFIPRSKHSSSADSTNFEFRIVTMLTFGPALTLLAFAVLSGRAVVAMWGYPLWLFLGLWLVMLTAPPLQPLPLARAVALWIVALVCYVIAFIADYAILPYHDTWIRASLYPGRALAANAVDGFERVTGRKLRYVIGSMWDAGNAAHYSPQTPQPQVVIESIERSPWIDVADLRKQGAVVIWTVIWRGTLANDYLNDYLKAVPAEFEPIAFGAKVQAPFRLDYYRGANVLYVGWAIIPPNPAGDARRLEPSGAVSPADTAVHDH